MPFEAGSIAGGLNWDISGYTQGMLKAEGIARNFPSVVQSFLASPLLGLVEIARSAAHAIWGAFTEVGKAGDDLGEQAEKVGVSADFLARVGAVAKDTGSSVQGLAEAMKFLNKNAPAGQSGEAGFFALADKIAAMQDPAQRTQLAMDLLGRSGAEMIPTLAKGSAGIQAMAADFNALHSVSAGRLAQIGDKFGTLTSYIQEAWQGLKETLAAPLLEFVAEHFEQIKASIISAVQAAVPRLQEFGQMIAEHLPAWIDTGVKAVSIMGNTLAWLADHLRETIVLMAAWQGLKAGMSVGSFFGPVGTIVGGLVGAASAAGAATYLTRNQTSTYNIKVDATSKEGQAIGESIGRELQATQRRKAILEGI